MIFNNFQEQDVTVTIKATGRLKNNGITFNDLPIQSIEVRDINDFTLFELEDNDLQKGRITGKVVIDAVVKGESNA